MIFPSGVGFDQMLGSGIEEQPVIRKIFDPKDPSFNAVMERISSIRPVSHLEFPLPACCGAETAKGFHPFRGLASSLP